VENYKIVVSDTTCFALLSKIGALELLKILFTEVYTSPEVAAEYGRPLPAWVNVQPLENRELLLQYPKI
jgi:predicted nucleic acid-binding protein